MRSATFETGLKPVFHLRIFSRFCAKRIFHLSLVSQLEPSGTNWIKTKENFASREKIRKWKTGLRPLYKFKRRTFHAPNINENI
jgi:hypothetical protein